LLKNIQIYCPRYLWKRRNKEINCLHAFWRIKKTSARSNSFERGHKHFAHRWSLNSQVSISEICLTNSFYCCLYIR